MRKILIGAFCLVVVVGANLLPPAVAVEGPGGSLKEEVDKSLKAALNYEKDETIHLFLAKAMIRLNPDDEDAAQVLVQGFLSKDFGTYTNAEEILNEVIVPAPPALVRALVPLLKHERKDVRLRTAKILSKIGPKALS